MKTITLLRNSIHSSLRRCGLLLISLLLGCFAISPMAQAQVEFGNGNTAAGNNALGSLANGARNTALGAGALFSLTTTDNNTAIGWRALRENRGDDNTATGAGALSSNTIGDSNTAVGWQALFENTTGTSNTAIGNGALEMNTDGAFNTAIGEGALANNMSGQNNTAIGERALRFSTGVDNTALGTEVGNNVTTASNVICIGANVGGANVSGTTWIGGVFGVTPQNGTTAPVVVSNAGQLGTVASSERFKKDIATMDKASEIILSLRPVTFHYKSDAKETPQFGLIAEEVAKVNPALVLPDKEGKPYTVRYDQVNAMLLNEFLKARRQIDAQQKQIDALTAGLQKVSAQLEVNKPAPQVVNNP